MSYRVNVIFSKDAHGYYVYSPDLPGCQSQGDTFEEARSNIKEAIELYIDTMDEEEIGEANGKELLTTTMEIEV